MGMGALSLLGMTWALPSGPAQWGHQGITSQGPGGGPTVSHHAAAKGPNRALMGPLCLARAGSGHHRSCSLVFCTSW